MVTSFSSQIDSFQFVILGNETDFNSGKLACESRGFDPAPINNRFQSDFLLEFLNQLRFTEEDLLYIGIQDTVENPVQQSGSTSRFEYLSPSGDEQFFQDPFLFPWIEDQPNDSTGSENCVAVRNINSVNNSVGYWEDVECTEELRIICINSLESSSEDDEDDSFEDEVVFVGIGILVGSILMLIIMVIIRFCCCNCSKRGNYDSGSASNHYIDNSSPRRVKSDKIDNRGFRN